MRLGHRLKSRQQTVGIADLRQHDHETFEIVMLMGAIERIMMRRPACEIVFRGSADAEQHGGIDSSLAHGDHLDRARHDGSDLAPEPRLGGGVDQIGLVEHDHVGGHELILIDLGQRVVVIDGGVFLALAGDGLGVVGETAFGDGRRIDHGDDAVDGKARADRGPIEGLDQGLRQRKAGGLDEDVLGRVGAVDQRLHGRHEILGDRAAQAAVGQLDDILFRACVDAATAQQFTIDADAAELVDDKREPLAAHGLKHMPHQRRFTGPEKAGDDGGGDACGRAHSAASLSGAACAGKRAMTVFCIEAGRPEGSTTPDLAAA